MPRSTSDRRGGPATFHHRYGPVTVADSTLLVIVCIVHGPKRIDSVSPRTCTYADRSSSPKRRAIALRGESNRNGNRWSTCGRRGGRVGLSLSTSGWWPGTLSSGIGPASRAGGG